MQIAFHSGLFLLAKFTRVIICRFSLVSLQFLIGEMISITKARRKLGKESNDLTDEQIEEILTSLYGLAESFYSLSEYDTNKPNGRKKS